MIKQHSFDAFDKPFDFRTAKQKAEDTKVTMHAVEAVKMVTFLALRNQGWGAKRLTEYNEQWNKILVMVSEGRLTLTDIADTLYDETGIGLNELRVN